MRVLVLLLAACLAAPPSAAAGEQKPQAADARASQAVRQAAQEMYAAFGRGDHEGFVNDLYPPVVKAMGGRARVLTAVKAGITEMQKNGMTVKSTVIEPPTQIVKVGKNGVQALLLTALIVGTPRGDMKLPTYLIGISDDAGKTWKFIDTGKVGNERLTKFFPDLSPDLKVPPKPAPEALKK